MLQLPGPMWERCSALAHSSQDRRRCRPRAARCRDCCSAHSSLPAAGCRRLLPGAEARGSRHPALPGQGGEEACASAQLRLVPAPGPPSPADALLMVNHSLLRSLPMRLKVIVSPAAGGVGGWVGGWLSVWRETGGQAAWCTAVAGGNACRACSGNRLAQPARCRGGGTWQRQAGEPQAAAAAAAAATVAAAAAREPGRRRSSSAPSCSACCCTKCLQPQVKRRCFWPLQVAPS
jgi:hypothetical protein